MDREILLVAATAVEAAATTLREADADRIEAKALQFARSTLKVAQTLADELRPRPTPAAAETKEPTNPPKPAAAPAKPEAKAASPAAEKGGSDPKQE